jgi:hypothetical protein
MKKILYFAVLVVPSAVWGLSEEETALRKRVMDYCGALAAKDVAAAAQVMDGPTLVPELRLPDAETSVQRQGVIDVTPAADVSAPPNFAEVLKARIKQSKQGQPNCEVSAVEFVEPFALVHIRAGAPSVTHEAVAVFRKNTEGWAWQVLHPLIPVGKKTKKESSGLLDGTRWAVRSEKATILFIKGLFIAAPGLFEKELFPTSYEASEKDGKVVWTAEVPNFLPESFQCKGEGAERSMKITCEHWDLEENRILATKTFQATKK